MLKARSRSRCCYYHPFRDKDPETGSWWDLSRCKASLSQGTLGPAGHAAGPCPSCSSLPLAACHPGHSSGPELPTTLEQFRSGVLGFPLVLWAETLSTPPALPLSTGRDWAASRPCGEMRARVWEAMAGEVSAEQPRVQDSERNSHILLCVRGRVRTWPPARS